MTDVQIVRAALLAAARGGAGLSKADRERAEALARLAEVASRNADRLPVSAEFKADGALALLTR